MRQHKYCHFVHELAIVSICVKTVHNVGFDDFSSDFKLNWLTFSCHYSNYQQLVIFQINYNFAKLFRIHPKPD